MAGRQVSDVPAGARAEGRQPPPHPFRGRVSRAPRPVLKPDSAWWHPCFRLTCWTSAELQVESSCLLSPQAFRPPTMPPVALCPGEGQALRPLTVLPEPPCCSSSNCSVEIELILKASRLLLWCLPAFSRRAAVVPGEQCHLGSVTRAFRRAHSGPRHGATPATLHSAFCPSL